MSDEPLLHQLAAASPEVEYILCAAIYVDTGKAEPPRRSHAYPKTGLVFTRSSRR